MQHFNRIIGCDLAGLSGCGAKSATATFTRREDGRYVLAKVDCLPRADAELRPDGEFLASLDATTLLVVDSPLQWPCGE
jgi:hypothetical protein